MLDPVRIAQRVDAHFAAVGRFMHEFAQVETATHAVLLQVSRQFHIQKSDAFGTLFLSRAIRAIRAAHSDAGQPLPDTLSRALSKLEEISRYRNTLAHNGAHFSEHFTSMASSRDMVAGHQGATIIDPIAFESLLEDLATIQAALTLVLLDDAPTLPSVEEMTRELGVSAWHQDMLHVLGIGDVGGAELKALVTTLAARDWRFQPVMTAGAPKDVLGVRPRPIRPRRRRVT